jgi:cytolysin-activating lysine-acyltransferase
MKDLVDSSGQMLPTVEAPPPDRLRVYGDLLFLAFRSDRHARMSTATLRAWLEPPVELGQFRVFRFDDVPRGMYTWGWLGPEAERKLIAGEVLTPEDWRSGDALWIVDLIAPYRGMTKSMVRFIMTPGNFSDRSFWFRRVTGVNETQRIVNIDFRRRQLARVLDDSAFLDRDRPE